MSHIHRNTKTYKRVRFSILGASYLEFESAYVIALASLLTQSFFELSVLTLETDQT